VGGAVTLRDTLTVNGAVTIANTLATGNTTVTGFANVTQSANVGTTLNVGGNTTIGGFVNVATTANVGGATTLRGTLTVNGAVTIANTTAFGNTATFQTDYVIDVFANTNLGSNTTAPQQIYSFAKATYKTAKFMVKAANTGGTNQMADMIVAHDGTAPYITVFGVVPDTAPIGEFSVTSNTTHIILRMQQTETSCKTTVVANLIK
jgi:hypothetical protein